MKRGDFIKLGTAGLAGAAFSGLPETSLSGRESADENISEGELKKGFMLQTFPSRDNYSLTEQFRMLKDAGFHGVEPESGLDREEVLEAKEASGLEIPSVVVSTHWSQPLSSPDSSTRAAGVEGVKIALQDAYEFGASTILLVPGVVNEEVSYDTVYRRSQREIRNLIPVAEELGIIIAVENVWNQFLLSPLEAARYIDELDSPFVKWYFDIGNIINFGFPEQWIRILADRIAMIHIKEFSREKRNDEGLWRGFQVNLTEGDNNWPEIMNALRDTGYSGYGIAEPPYRPEGVGDREWLEEYISGRMDSIFAHYSES
jgi:L-ribulose-5-phosphate 3-epimerase